MPRLVHTTWGITHLLANIKHLHVYSANRAFLMYSTKMCQFLENMHAYVCLLMVITRWRKKPAKQPNF